MGVYIKGMEMPTTCGKCKIKNAIECNRWKFVRSVALDRHRDCPLVPVPEYGRLKKRVVYRGDVFNALESARIIALDGIFADRYKDGFHDGLKRALEILANEVQDVQILEMYMPFFIPKWIPVTEQLPPAEKEVYVTDGEYIARANLLDEVFPGDKPCWSYSGLGEITHWCEHIPLPHPPKGGMSMGVYIKSLEPKNEPPLVKINPDGSINAIARNGYRKYEAIPVQPHGDLIEKSVIKKAIEDSCAECEEMCLEFDGLCADCNNCSLSWVKKALTDAQTIIPASEEGET